MAGNISYRVKILSGDQAIQVVRGLNRWLNQTKDVTWAQVQGQIQLLVDRVLRGRHV